MLMTSRLKVLLWILVLVIIAALGMSFYLGVHQAQAPTTDQSIPNADGSPHAIFPFTFTDWPAEEYTNSYFNYEIQYPSDFQLDDSNKELVEISSNLNSLEGDRLNIGTTEFDPLAADCLQTPSNGYSEISDIGTTTINGISFYSYSFRAPTSHVGDNRLLYGKRYSIIRNNECFSLLEISPSSQGMAHLEEITNLLYFKN